MPKTKRCRCNAKHVGPCPCPAAGCEFPAGHDLKHPCGKRTASPRKPEEIAQEYGKVCAEIGDLTYRRDFGIPERIDELMRKARDLNLESFEAEKQTPTPESK